MNEIFHRTSIRKYLDKPVEDEKIKTILQAAMAAPSAGNQQPLEFYVVMQQINISPNCRSLQINFSFSFLFRSLRAAFCGTLFSSPPGLLLKTPIVIFRNHKKKKTPRPDSIGLLLHHTINTPLERCTNGITVSGK